jgi:hypothetical protein
MRPTSIVSFHTNPYTCGVARFNVSLAQSLDVQLVGLSDYLIDPLDGSLLSIKCEELGSENTHALSQLLESGAHRFDLYLHGVDGSSDESLLIRSANRVFAASMEIGDLVRPIRVDVVDTFAPGALPSTKIDRADCTLLTFGMAHKIRSSGYRKLGEILKNDRRTFRLEISTALHEGTTFSEDFFTVGTEISEVFDGNVSFLGFLADDEVSRRMHSADALVAFFPNGVRENNTTVLSAMAHGCAVITNLDENSPKWMKHGFTVLDVNLINKFPSGIELKTIGEQARVAVKPFNFANLGRLLSE